MTSPTIYDVARAAGVATSTVSRSHNNPARVSPATREHVLRVARELGYSPNPHARALTSSRTRTLALVVSDITNPHFFELIRGAELRAKASEHTLVLVDAEESPHVELQQVRRLARSVDGFLLAASRLPDDELVQIATEHTVVLVNRRVRGLASVGLDQEAGCRQIVEHLASLGHTSIVYLAGPRTSWSATRRWAALEASAAEQGLTATRTGPYAPTVSSGGAAADAALRSGATAVVAHNDLLAIGVLRRLAERSVRVPEDLSVVGFDDIFAADLCTPSLTTLGGPHGRIGRAAVEILLDSTASARTSTWSPPQVVMPPSLVLRRSTSTAAQRHGN